MRLFDTLSGRKTAFRPLRGKAVTVYTCGPSVYNYSHIGNFRTYAFEDLLVRYLRYKGYEVKRVMNITDVEDKSIAAAREAKVGLQALVKDKIRAFLRDFDDLGLERPAVIAKASEHVPAMVALIGRICRKGHCIREKDGIYFDVRGFRRYGALRHLRDPRYLGAARRDDYSREALYDFRLWKAWTPSDGKVCWDSPFGRGRPGWHIECSAIAMGFLGDTIDVHCGGTDNIFPHHENEIAQSESATGKRFVRHWMHVRHLTVGKKKMSKRTGNVYYVQQLKKLGVPPNCLRFYLISGRYRKTDDFTIKQFKERVCLCNSTRALVKRLEAMREGGKPSRAGAAIARRLVEGFESAMDDDLDTPLAFRRIFRETAKVEALMAGRMLSGADASAVLAALMGIDSVLGLFQSGPR
jgi:cysteinyl-tRNA synthetase